MQTLQSEDGGIEGGRQERKKKIVACFLHSMFSFTEGEAQPMGKSIAQISIPDATSMSVYPLVKHCPSRGEDCRARHGETHREVWAWCSVATHKDYYNHEAQQLSLVWSLSLSLSTNTILISGSSYEVKT